MKKGSLLYKQTGIFQPIYQDDYIVITHDNDSAVPGFYKINPILYKESIIDLTDIELRMFSYMQWFLRENLKKKFNIDICCLFFEEHPGKKVTSYTLPIHISQFLKLYDLDSYQLYIEQYLYSYSFSSSFSQISLINESMISSLGDVNVRRGIENIKNGNTDFKSPRLIYRETIKDKPKIDDILEVFEENELPPAPDGKKYYTCIGGRKNFQCFLTDGGMSKGQFLKFHGDIVDDCVKPIYYDNELTVRQDSKYAIPGFYIVSTQSDYRNINDMPQKLFIRCMVVARDIKKGLSELGLKRSFIYNDEKYKGSASAHLWVFTIHDSFLNKHSLNDSFYSKDIWNYVDTFPRYQETKKEILSINEKLKIFLADLYQ